MIVAAEVFRSSGTLSKPCVRCRVPVSMPADKISEAVRFSATDQTLQDFCVHTA